MDKNLLNNKINELVFLFKNNQISKALVVADELIDLKINIPSVLNLIGLVKFRSGDFEASLAQFSTGLEIDSNNYELYNNKGLVFYNLGKFTEAIKYFNKCLILKEDYHLAYYNLANTYIDLADFEKAILNFDQVIKHKVNFHEARNRIIQSLTYYNPINLSSNIFVKVNKELQKLNFNFSELIKINNENIKSYYSNCIEIVNKSITHLEYNFSQIYRRDKIDLNCSRHFAVFNKYSVIPEYCFGCYKIQIEPKDVVDLIKLYFVFDNINLTKSRLRKCMIEMRPDIPGPYKGLIYCSSLQDVEETTEIIAPILKNTINNKIKIFIKRGCSEFSQKYPEFTEFKNSKKIMKYPSKWKDAENKTDEILPKKNYSSERVLPKTIKGQTLSDILIISNWICYARAIKDYSYKGVIDEFNESIFISKKIQSQKIKKNKEFKKQNLN